MKIKKNDSVKIISGKDAGKSGKVIKALPQKNKITVEGLNLRTKHMRPKKSGEKGQRISFPASLHISNVMLICPKCNRSVRVGHKIMENKKSVRFCKKCREII